MPGGFDIKVSSALFPSPEGQSNHLGSLGDGSGPQGGLKEALGALYREPPDRTNMEGLRAMLTGFLRARLGPKVGEDQGGLLTRMLDIADINRDLKVNVIEGCLIVCYSYFLLFWCMIQFY